MEHAASPQEDITVPIITRHTLAAIGPGAIPPEGALLLVDKPATWTSFDVVAKTRRLLNVKKVGHTGTLDPMATGLLVLCLGKATKLADRIQAGIKEYTGSIRLDATTTTDDAEGEVTGKFTTDDLTPEAIEEAVKGFLGESLQRPPMFSARKVGGQRLYKLARRGEQVDVPAKPITIYDFRITRIELPDIDVHIVCSKGTYIRSIARDLGLRLGSGGYLTALRRTRSGEFRVDDAVTMEMLREAYSPDTNSQTQ